MSRDIKFGIFWAVVACVFAGGCDSPNRHPSAEQEFRALAVAEGRTAEALKALPPPAPPPPSPKTVHQKICALCGALPKNQLVWEDLSHQFENRVRQSMCTTPKVSGFGHHVSLADCVAIAKFKAGESNNEQ